MWSAARSVLRIGRRERAAAHLDRACHSRGHSRTLSVCLLGCLRPSSAAARGSCSSCSRSPVLLLLLSCRGHSRDCLCDRNHGDHLARRSGLGTLAEEVRGGLHEQVRPRRRRRSGRGRGPCAAEVDGSSSRCLSVCVLDPVRVPWAVKSGKARVLSLLLSLSASARLDSSAAGGCATAA